MTDKPATIIGLLNTCRGALDVGDKPAALSAIEKAIELMQNIRCNIVAELDKM